MKKISLLLILTLVGCLQEVKHEHTEENYGSPLPYKAPIDWELSEPMIYSTNIGNNKPILIRYEAENMPNSPPLIDRDILPNIEFKDKTSNQSYNIEAKLTYGDRLYGNQFRLTYIELDVGTMQNGLHSLKLDSFQRQETIEYPISVGNTDAPSIIDIRYTAHVGKDTEMSGIVVLIRFSEPISFNTNAIQILDKGSTYIEHTTYTNEDRPGNLVQMTIYHKPGTILAGTTLKFSIDGSAIVSAVSGKSIIPITENIFDLSDRFVYTDKMQQYGNTMVFEQVLPPMGGGILWGVDLTANGLRTRAVSE